MSDYDDELVFYPNNQRPRTERFTLTGEISHYADLSAGETKQMPVVRIAKDDKFGTVWDVGRTVIEVPIEQVDEFIELLRKAKDRYNASVNAKEEP